MDARLPQSQSDTSQPTFHNPKYTHQTSRRMSSVWSLLDDNTKRSDKMDIDAAYAQPHHKSHPVGYDMEVASTLAHMADGRGHGTTTATHFRSLSPSWSHSSVASDDGSNESARSDGLSSVEGSSGWPSPLTQCSSASSSFSGSFSSDCHERSLPRLPELDLISLETLASHYAKSIAADPRHVLGERSARPSFLLPHPSSMSVQPICQTPGPLPPMEADSLPVKVKRNPPARGTRCNVKYTIEQKDFIDYWRIDRNERETPWDDVVREYNAQFRGPHRRNGGLQSAYYRENKKIPVVDRDGLLVFDERGELKTIEVPVREAKSRLHSVKSIGLLASHPERALKYSWVTREHKRRVWRIGHARQAQLDAARKQQRRLSDDQSPIKITSDSLLSRPRAHIEAFEAPLIRPAT